MGLSMRTAREQDDYWRIREFLREVFLLNGRRELSWQAYRFDYCRWHGGYRDLVALVPGQGQGGYRNDYSGKGEDTSVHVDPYLSRSERMA